MKLAFLVLVAAASASAQTTTTPTFGPPIVGSPYSIVRQWEMHKVLPDGKKQQSHSTLKLYRDSAGRTRTDMEIDSSGLISTVVIDRAARVEYWWNNKSKICMMKKLGEAVPIRPYEPMAVGATRTRYLGTGDARQKEVLTGVEPKSVEGLETAGLHIVRYAPGSDTVVSTVDSWYQPDLHLNLYMDRDDTGKGHQTWRFHHLKRDEPKAELFAAPPKGYEVREAESPNEDKFE